MDITAYTNKDLLEGRARTDAFKSTGTIATTPPRTAGSDESTTVGEDLFDTLIDTVNPLQHIPGVSSVYRAVTDDAINPLSSMAGGWLFGGPVGLAAGAASSFLELVTGKSLMGHAMAMFSGEQDPQDSLPGAVQAVQANGDTDVASAADTSVSLAQYQAFAKAAATTQRGFGAKADDVAWSTNVWTAHALKQATGVYESSQNIGDGAKDRASRTV